MLRLVTHQNRGHTSWLVCLLIITTISSIGNCKPVSGNPEEDSFLPVVPASLPPLPSSSSSLPQRKTLDQEIGSPSELAWRAWLLVENKGAGQSALDSSNILRRITPKSIFIAPELVSCPNGYSLDGKGGCKPDPISIDEDAQRQFLLKRLNILYGKNGNNRKKPAEPSGPLQINIPFALPGKPGSPEKLPAIQLPPIVPQNPELEPIAGDRFAIPVVITQQAPVQQSDNNKNQDPVAVVVYKMTNNTKVEDHTEAPKTTYPPGSSTTMTTTTQNGHVVPVAEILDEANETFSGIVDYKIPISLKPVLNRSDIFDLTKPENNRQASEKKVDVTEIKDDTSPTVVLLLSPTKVSTTVSPPKEYETSDLDYFDRSTTKQHHEQRENTTVTEANEDTKLIGDTTIQTVSPLNTETAPEQLGSTLTSTERTYTDDRMEDETAYTDEETQTEQVSEDHEDYDDATEEVDPDEFGEGEDELLKPGEAGMMVSSKHPDLIRSKVHKHKMTTTVDAEDSTSTTLVDTTTTQPISPPDILGTFTTSESTMKSDATTFVKEEIASTLITELPSTIITTELMTEEATTLPVIRPLVAESLVKSTTRAHPTQIPTTTIVENKDIKTTSSLDNDKDLVTEPEVILSTQGSHSMTTSYGRKRPNQQTTAKVTETLRPVIDSDSEGGVLSKTELPSTTLDSHLITDFKRTKPPLLINNEPILFKNDGNIPSEFSGQIVDSIRPAFTDFRRVPTHSLNNEPSSFIRFPEQVAEDRSHQHPGFVRFPSDEVNSIHNQDTYKEHLLSPYRSREDIGGNSPTSTKSSVPARQKPPSAQWRVPPPGARTDRQQTQQQQQQQAQAQAQASSASQRQRQQKPMLLRFWARMPLVRDLSFYPTTSHGSHNEPIGGANTNNNDDNLQRPNSRFAPAATSPSTRRLNYYKELSSHDVNRLLAQQLGQSAIGG